MFCKSGRFYTCAGVTAGIDLALALIEEDQGPGVALSVARELVVYLKRPGGQEQYSEPLKLQSAAPHRFADLVAWIRGHLHEDLSVERLASRTHLSPRQFNRTFKSSLGASPAAFVETMRLAEARARLTEQGLTVKALSHALGFRSADAFRRAFERRFGLSPSSYRLRFSSSPPEGSEPSPMAE